jgi:tetratricopeptide (TPR) repeat protein
MRRIITICCGALAAVSLSGCGGCSVQTGPIYFPDGVTMENNENYNKANIAFQKRQTQEGIAFLEKAAEDGYRHPFIFSRLANQSGYLEKYDEALTYSQRAIDILESKDIKVMFPNELEMFKEDKRPRIMADAYSLHALILYQLGRADEAESLAQKSFDLHSEDPRAREVLGRLAIDEKRYDKAISIFEDFIQQSPRYHDAHFHLGRALLGKGEIEEGKTSLHTYLARVPASHPNAKTARALLNRQHEGTDRTTTKSTLSSEAAPSAPPAER